MRQIVSAFLAAGLLLGLMPLIAQAKDSPDVPTEQSRMFALAYTLRACDLRAQDYVEAVQSLNTIDDIASVNAETARQSRETSKLRHTQGIAYAQAARLLQRMGAPSDVRIWAAKTASQLKSPLVYDHDAQNMAKTEPDAGLVMAELNELQEIRAASDAQQPAIAIWLKLTGGPIGIWTADLGSFVADLHRAAVTPGPSRLIGKAALRLLLKAPPGTPSSAYADLSELVPSGGGNLQDLPVTLPQVTPREKISRVYSELMSLYVPGKPIER